MLCFGLILVLTGCAQNKQAADTGKNPNKITIDQELSNQLDIKTEPIGMRQLALNLPVTGSVHPDVGRETDVNTRFSGRVMEVLVKPGQVVNSKTVLALIDSHEVSQLQAELLEAQSKVHIAQAQEDRERQVYEEQLLRPKSLIQARTHHDECKVQLELAHSEYDRQSGLYKEKISSQRDYLLAKGNLARAKATFEQAEADLQREERLYKNKAIMMRDYKLAQAETARLHQHMNTLLQRLEFLGVPDSVVKDVLRTGKIKGVIPVVSPAHGVVSHQDISVGEFIDSHKTLFVITDLTSVVVTADIPEVDLSQVKLGNEVSVRIAGYPNEVFKGTIDYIADHVNPKTRTVAIRARLDNSRNMLKANMFAEIVLEGNPQNVLACPKSAIQDKEGQKVVFIKDVDGFEEKTVSVGREDDRFVEILTGLSAGDLVVTQGSLMLKAELSYKR